VKFKLDENLDWRLAATVVESEEKDCASARRTPAV